MRKCITSTPLPPKRKKVKRSLSGKMSLDRNLYNRMRTTRNDKYAKRVKDFLFV
jgi:hypothetical protein